MALSVASRYALPGCGDRPSLGSRPRLARSLCQVIAPYALRLNYRADTDGSTVSSLICDRWLILGLDAQYSSLIEPVITDGLLLYV